MRHCSHKGMCEEIYRMCSSNSNAAVFSEFRADCRHLGQVLPVPKTGLRGDCDFVKRVSRAGHGNDRVWKAWKAKKPAFYPFHNPWKSLRDYHIPTALTAGMFQGARAPETESKALSLKGVVMEVLGPKCNGCSGTLTGQPLRLRSRQAEAAVPASAA